MGSLLLLKCKPFSLSPGGSARPSYISSVLLGDEDGFLIGNSPTACQTNGESLLVSTDVITVLMMFFNIDNADWMMRVILRNVFLLPAGLMECSDLSKYSISIYRCD